MAASAPDPETPLAFKIVVNRMAGQAIIAWNRPFRSLRTGLVTGYENRVEMAGIVKVTKSREFGDNLLTEDLRQ